MKISIGMIATVISVAKKIKAMFAKHVNASEDAERAELVKYWNANASRVADGDSQTGPK